MALTRRDAVRLVALAVAVPVAARQVLAGADGVQLAIKGYDPVAYFTLGKPTKGVPEIAFEWDEHRYQFARTEHRELFKAAPTRYAPQFANFCAMALTRAELDEGNPEYWLIREGKLYLFGKPIGPNLFQQAFADNLDKVGQNQWLIKKR